MATSTQFHEHIEEHHPIAVRSRINWGPILGGVAIAFAVYVLLALFGTALGWSAFSSADGFSTWAAAWATLTIIVSLFVGGWVCSRCTVGEDRTESILYGAILWGTMFLILLFLAAFGVALGFNAMLGFSLADATTGTIVVSGQETLAEELSDAATWAAWWAFAGTLLSMAAAIGGSCVGAGTHRHMRHHTADRTVHTPTTGPMGTPRAT